VLDVRRLPSPSRLSNNGAATLSDPRLCGGFSIKRHLLFQSGISDTLVPYALRSRYSTRKLLVTIPRIDLASDDDELLTTQ